MSSNGSSAESNRSASPMIGVSLDGSTLNVAEVTLKDERIVVQHMRHSEENKHLEIIKQLRHPVHNELNSLEYPEPDKLRKLLTNLLPPEQEKRPLLASLSQECFRQWEQTIDKDPEHVAALYAKGTKKCLHSNPYGYPLLFGYSRNEAEENQEAWKFWSARFDDFLHTAELFKSVPHRFSGAVSPYRALSEVLPRVLDVPEDKPVTIVHTGKLRTYYIGFLNGQVKFIRAIPVGISRDGPEYFQTLSPNLKKLGKLVMDYGSLIMPADTTPSALFSKNCKSPQSEATRFAHQVAEFTAKVQFEIWESMGINEMGDIFISGTVSRLMGLREFLSERVGIQFRNLTEILSDKLEYDKGMLSCCITDYLIPIGNCLAWNEREASRSGLILTDQRPESRRFYRTEDGPLENNQMYVIEYPREMAFNKN